LNAVSNHLYLGAFLDKVNGLPDETRGRQVQCDIKVHQKFRGRELERLKESSMNAIGPDCSFAETFCFFLRDAKDVKIEFEFENPNNSFEYGQHDITRNRIKRFLWGFRLDFNLTEKKTRIFIKNFDDFFYPHRLP